MAKTYIGKTCKVDPTHGAVRYKSNYTCVECQKSYNRAVRKGLIETEKRLQCEPTQHKIQTPIDPWRNPFKPKSNA